MRALNQWFSNIVIDKRPCFVVIQFTIVGHREVPYRISWSVSEWVVKSAFTQVFSTDIWMSLMQRIHNTSQNKSGPQVFVDACIHLRPISVGPTIGPIISQTLSILFGPPFCRTCAFILTCRLSLWQIPIYKKSVIERLMWPSSLNPAHMSMWRRSKKICSKMPFYTVKLEKEIVIVSYCINISPCIGHDFCALQS